jgi:hypothetical protein
VLALVDRAINNPQMSKPCRVVAALLAAILCVAAIWLLPQQLVSTGGLKPDEYASHLDAARTAVIQTLAASALVVGLFFTAATLRLNKEGHITDRLTKAVEQLGATQLSTRIGGLYALERIMRDSAVDHAPVVEIIAAFVRENATDRGEAQDSSASWTGPPLPGVPQLAADVQAAVTVLGRRPERTEPGRLLDLRGTDLRGVLAHGARLRGAILIRARFDHADLGEADFRDARLRQASLRHAWLRPLRCKGRRYRMRIYARPTLPRPTIPAPTSLVPPLAKIPR